MAALKLLVVEDDRLIREELRDLFEAEGYEVDVACHGAEALERLRSDCGPQVILTDLRMPVMDGWCLLQQLKDHPRWRFIPVVIASADIDPCRGGATLMLRKPFRAHEVVSAVARQAQVGASQVHPALLAAGLRATELGA